MEFSQNNEIEYRKAVRLRLYSLRDLFLVMCFLLSSNLFANELPEILNRNSVATVFAEIDRLDQDYLEVEVFENEGRKLLGDLSVNPPESYKKTMNLVRLFDPRTNSNDHRRLAAEIEAYVQYLSRFKVIQLALQRTGTSLSDLKSNWFGSGRGFEHIIAGELKGNKVSGYHWWYRYYVDQQNGLVKYEGSKKAIDDSNVFIGSFRWDPDGEGPLPRSYKKLGGFHIGQSAPALIAAGHVAMEYSKRGGYAFAAPYRGKMYYWQTYSYEGNLRTMFCKTYRPPLATRLRNFLKLYN